MIDCGLEESDIDSLRRQEKQILGIIDELKNLHANHTKSILAERKRQQLHWAAQKVVAAIQSKSTDNILGKDMAMLVELIQNDNYYSNSATVEKIISKGQEFFARTILHVQ